MVRHAELSVSLGALRAAIREEYTAVAQAPEQGFHFHTGEKLAKLLGYPEEWLAKLPVGALESFAGTGNPLSIEPVRPGYRIVDLGSGAGFDSLIAARLVGPSGSVIGVDMTPAMLEKAWANAAHAGLQNVEFRAGYAEALPIDDAWADVIISNGVLNLIPNKAVALREMYRALKPGGRLQIADIVVKRPVPLSALGNVSLWTGCIAGGLLENELQGLVQEAGFQDFQITETADVFSGAPQSSSAAAYGTVGINFHARKPG